MSTAGEAITPLTGPEAPPLQTVGHDSAGRNNAGHDSARHGNPSRGSLDDCAGQNSAGHDAPVLYNRIGAMLEHIPWYGFRAQVRLAQDSGVSEAAISRLLRGECLPSLVVALQVTRAIERRLGRPLDVRELFSLDGRFPTAFPCQLASCNNCLPAACYDEQDGLRSECHHMSPGRWSLVQPHQAHSHQPPHSYHPLHSHRSLHSHGTAPYEPAACEPARPPLLMAARKEAA